MAKSIDEFPEIDVPKAWSSCALGEAIVEHGKPVYLFRNFC